LLALAFSAPALALSSECPIGGSGQQINSGRRAHRVVRNRDRRCEEIDSLRRASDPE
jgi:hypothetical protein